jgi:hypothetical protein
MSLAITIAVHRYWLPFKTTASASGWAKPEAYGLDVLMHLRIQLSRIGRGYEAEQDTCRVTMFMDRVVGDSELGCSPSQHTETLLRPRLHVAPPQLCEKLMPV